MSGVALLRVVRTYLASDCDAGPAPWLRVFDQPARSEAEDEEELAAATIAALSRTGSESPQRLLDVLHPTDAVEEE